MNYMKCLLVMSAILLSAGSVNAHDSKKLKQLEKDINGLNDRIELLESMFITDNKNQVKKGLGEGWKSISNWRKLKTDMSYSDVEKILGSPSRVRGGVTATWYYDNEGEVHFMRDLLRSWNEPF